MKQQLQTRNNANTQTGVSQETPLHFKDRVPSTLGICNAGYPFFFIALTITVLGALFVSKTLLLVLVPITCWVAWFFRDPVRQKNTSPDEVISPADGKIIEVRETQYPRLLQGPCLKISIFMNVFNVHVNRSPFEGTVKKLEYNKGKFIPANAEKASLENEQMAVAIETPRKSQILFIQIAGLVARRIICNLSEGDVLAKGEKYGLIRFGSRMDVYLPLGSESLVKVGQHVQGGLTELARIKES